MKKFIASILVSLTALMGGNALAAGSSIPLENADIDIHNKQSLQRGAKYYVNYCMGCHALSYSRYNRVAADLGLTDKQVAENFIFTRDEDGLQKVGALMENAMRKRDVEEGFGSAPPDLSLVGRSRGGDWIYSYLKAFYLDPSRPMGVNNTIFPNVGMPHVLWELQGWQEKKETCEGEGEHKHCTSELVLDKPGKMPAPEYNQVVRDITNFLVYVGEPAQLHRKTIGIFVLLFLVFFGVLAYFLKKEYWKDVH